MTERNIMEGPGRFSLLYPRGYEDDMITPDQQALKDIEIETLVRFMMPKESGNRLLHECIRRILLAPCRKKETIVYRQDIFETLLRYPDLLSAFEKLLPVISLLNFHRNVRNSGQPVLYKTVSRIYELENYIACLDILRQAFERIIEKSPEKKLASPGLQYLYDFIRTTCTDELFLHLKEQLPKLSSKLRNIRSITVGINLSNTLRPVEATIVSVSNETYQTGDIFSQLFGPAKGILNGISPLYSSISPDGVPMWDKNPLIKQLFEDLSKILEKTCKPIQSALNKYITINTQLFIDIREDILFYIQGTHLINTLKQAKMPVCRPVIAPPEARQFEIEDNYNINLFIQMHLQGRNIAAGLVKNRVALNDDGRIAIITGPNQGGKTVYAESVGLSMFMFQTGLFVPGSGAVISPADNLFTHFQIEEHLEDETGRFADEARRLHAIIKNASPYSIILMNESFASTNYAESLYIAQDIMKILKRLGVRVIFSTHFHDLALQVDEMNRTEEGDSKLTSLVSIVEKTDGAGHHIIRTYKIIPHPPMGKSYASEIAEKYGIDYNNLFDLIKSKGIN